MTDHVCPVCEDAFATESRLDSHCWDAHGACHHCGTELDDRTALFAHWLAAHDDSLSRKARARATDHVDELTFRQRVQQQGLADAIATRGMTRRRMLAGSLLGLGSLAGATFLGGSDGGGEPIADHPAAASLATQPVLGPDPSTADGTIVAFEDPSCPSCARFERSVFPRLKSDLVDTGQVSFVFRGIPVVYPWGDPAVLALEATHERSVEAFWSLKTFCYDRQGDFDTGNVRELTRQHLAEQTEVDADAVISAVENDASRSAVEADLEASEQAGVRGTPTFFLFSSGSFVTEVVGPQSYDVFANALGV